MMDSNNWKRRTTTVEWSRKNIYHKIDEWRQEYGVESTKIGISYEATKQRE